KEVLDGVDLGAAVADEGRAAPLRRQVGRVRRDPGRAREVGASERHPRVGGGGADADVHLGARVERDAPKGSLALDRPLVSRHPARRRGYLPGSGAGGGGAGGDGGGWGGRCASRYLSTCCVMSSSGAEWRTVLIATFSTN